MIHTQIWRRDIDKHSQQCLLRKYPARWMPLFVCWALLLQITKTRDISDSITPIHYWSQHMPHRLTHDLSNTRWSPVASSTIELSGGYKHDYRNCSASRGYVVVFVERTCSLRWGHVHYYTVQLVYLLRGSCCEVPHKLQIITPLSELINLLFSSSLITELLIKLRWTRAVIDKTLARILRHIYWPEACSLNWYRLGQTPYNMKTRTFRTGDRHNLPLCNNHTVQHIL